jgi:hypothetical protein
MRWFRANRLVGGCLALFALAIQFAVSFAHIHPQDSIPKENLTFVAKASNALSMDVASSLSAPLDDRGTGWPPDDCPICASIVLISSAITGQVPVLSVPTAFSPILLQSIRDFEFQSVRYSSFQTRAPPVV